MPPKPAPRDDDDVVEDYEVFDEQPSNKRPAAKSGAGQPVLRKQPSVAGGRKPTAPMRPGSASRQAVAPVEGDPGEGSEFEQPPAYDPNKGKISARSAKQIWIICIAITVFGLSAVVVDYVFDPMGRRNKGNPINGNTKAGNTAKKDDRPKDPLSELAENFNRSVGMEMSRLRQKKPFKFYQTAYNKFVGTRSMAYDAMADKETSKAAREKAWAEVYNDYYQAQYAKNLFMSVYRQGMDGVETITLKDEEARMRLAKDKGDAILKEDFVRLQAAATLVDAWSADVNQFWTGMRKGDSFVGDIFLDERYKPVFKVSKDKFEKACGEPPVFDQADLEAIKE